MNNLNDDNCMDCIVMCGEGSDFFFGYLTVDSLKSHPSLFSWCPYLIKLKGDLSYPPLAQVRDLNHASLFSQVNPHSSPIP